MQNRRKNTRVQLNNPVQIFCEDDEDYPIPGYLRDISLGGLFIYTTEKLPIGENYRLEVVLYEPGDSINVWLEGKAVRQEQQGFAVQITGFYQESFARLRDLLLYGGAEAEASLGLSPTM